MIDAVLSPPDAGADGRPRCEPTAPPAFCVEWQLPPQDETTAADEALCLVVSRAGGLVTS